MQTSPLPEEQQAQNWSVEDIDEHIDRIRLAMKIDAETWDDVRTGASAIVGLKVSRNLKLGKRWNDGFKTGRY